MMKKFKVVKNIFVDAKLENLPSNQILIPLFF